MKPAADLSLDELDAEIARLRGWDDDGGGIADGILWRWTNATPEHEREYEPEGAGPPPFSREWALAGPLLEEMRDTDATLSPCVIPRGQSAWQVEWSVRGSRAVLTKAWFPCEAIARAWLAWKRGPGG